MYSCQLSSSEKSLVGKRFIHISQRFYKFLLQYIFLIFLRNVCLPCRLRKTYAILWAVNRFVGSEISKHNAFNLINENFEKLNSISNIFLETRDFLVLTNSIIICIYLRKSKRKLLWKKPQEDIFTKVRHPTSNLLRCDLVQ